MRINKYIASKGIASRRKVDEMINQGKVLLNGSEAQAGSILKEGDVLEIGTVRLVFSSEENNKKILLAFNKPAGVICTNEKQEENNIPNYIKNNPDKFLGSQERYEEIRKARLFSVGRLDKDSRGLLLLTNDGDLSQKMTHPKYEKEKEYIVVCEKEIDDDFIQAFSAGPEITTEGRQVKTNKNTAKKISSHKFSCILKQGYKRQIRLMVGALGNKVKDLERIRIAGIKLDGLTEGYYKELIGEG